MRVIGRKRFRVKVEWKGDFGKLMAQNVTTVGSLKEHTNSHSGVRSLEVPSSSGQAVGALP